MSNSTRGPAARTQSLRIVVTGLSGSIPIAGLTLHYLQYVLGLRALGHDVLYLEDTGSWYYDPRTDAMVDDVTIPVTYLAGIMKRFDLADAWTFVGLDRSVYGVSGPRLRDFLATADLFINVTGAGLLTDQCASIGHRAYIDTDPGYIHLRLASGSRKDREHLDLHTVYFTFGCNAGQPQCLIPTGGMNWHPTVQPICLDLWPLAQMPPQTAPFTTVLKWQSYQPIEFEGEVYGLKDVEFLKFRNLPQLTEQPLEIAMTGKPPLDNLQGLGWRCEDGLRKTATIEEYRGYIHASRAEWSVAKNAYVKMRSGWFSDRSAAFLASGRPVVLQETGFSDWLSSGAGVLAFSTLEDAVSAIDEINNHYDAHRKAARAIAEEYFDAEKVLAAVIEKSYAE